MRQIFRSLVVVAVLSAILTVTACGGQNKDSITDKNSISEGTVSGISQTLSSENGEETIIKVNEGLVYSLGDEIDLSEVFVVTGKTEGSLKYTVEYLDGVQSISVKNDKFNALYPGSYRVLLTYSDVNGKIMLYNIDLEVKSNWSAAELGAVYASDIPVIDGKIDDIWVSAEKFYTVSHIESKSQAQGYVSVMWTENGLYFLGIVYDTTVNNSDMINFWVNEDYTKTGWQKERFYTDADNVSGGYVDSYYSANASDGAYSICADCTGTIHYYAAFDVRNEPKTKIAASFLETNNERYGYIVEAFMPVMTNGKAFTEGDTIGFNVSIDDYFEEGGSRVYYCNLSDTGNYWVNPAALLAVELKN